MDPAVTHAGAPSTSPMRVDIGGPPDIVAPLWLRIPDLETLPPSDVAKAPSAPRAALVSTLNALKSSDWVQWAARTVKQYRPSPVVVLVGVVVIAGILILQLRGGDESESSEQQSASAPTWEAAPGPAPWRGQPGKSFDSVAEPEMPEMQGPAFKPAEAEQPTAEYSPWSPPDDAEISVWPRGGEPAHSEAATSNAARSNLNPGTRSSVYNRESRSASVAELDGTIRKSTVR